jgi:hypothetical protein
VVEFELVLDILSLFFATDGSDDCESFPLGQLSDDLSYSTGGSRDEDGLALLWLADFVE